MVRLIESEPDQAPPAAPAAPAGGAAAQLERLRGLVIEAQRADKSASTAGAVKAWLAVESELALLGGNEDEG